MSQKVWLIGAGLMAQEYTMVLKALGTRFLVVGRGEQSAKKFEETTGIRPFVGGLEPFLKSNPDIPDGAIVAVSIEELSRTAALLLNCGVKHILLEKPGVGYVREIYPLTRLAGKKKAYVLLAYNRRFYASVRMAKEIIRQDGGVTSFHFEFTEWSHVVGKLKKHEAEHSNWFLGNSTHVVDTAFYLGGKPKKISTFVKGKKNLSWHPASSVFAGAGETKGGTLFSYHANWEAPGRWGIEFMTKKHRLILRPMEKLQIQKTGSIAVEAAEGIDYTLDEKFKPGLFLQTQSFLNSDHSCLCTVKEQALFIRNYYLSMSGYQEENV